MRFGERGDARGAMPESRRQAVAQSLLHGAERGSNARTDPPVLMFLDVPAHGVGVGLNCTQMQTKHVADADNADKLADGDNW